MRHNRYALLLACLLATGSLLCTRAQAQRARISEEIRSIETYPFSEPNPIPILSRDARLYPYHSFEGYSHESMPQDWNVVKLENDLIEVYVLPEAGGKIWGALVKKSGHEFIYRNEVMKFRNISLRGPWTSGGIEFNFGVIGHTPSTATPVDYRLMENEDGSVSCIVGAMDLPSRTVWRVEIRLPADRGAFETRTMWHNPTPLVQPYYNWMTAAAFATDDLEMTIPGSAYLEHGGNVQKWPYDDEGRFLPVYANNTFGSNKSFHVVGEMADFFGGYYRDSDYGFGHWSPYEQMPGQKLWLWALSRQGGIWEDLLTDTDGQYVEYQAGRLFVQYAPGHDINPIKQAGFDPGATDRWTEVWFPLEGTGGLSQASDRGALYASRTDEGVDIRVTSFGSVTDSIEVRTEDGRVWADGLDLEPLGVYRAHVDVPQGSDYTVSIPGLGLDYASDPAGQRLDRSFKTPGDAIAAIPEPERLLNEGLELMKGRRYSEARSKIERALRAAPWSRRANIAMADLDYRRGLYTDGMTYIRKALQLDAYGADANFTAGNLYRALGKTVDAREAFGWAARSMAYRSVANVELAELDIIEGHPMAAIQHAHTALDYDRYNMDALETAAIASRQLNDRLAADAALESLLSLDPIHHFALFERYLWNRTPVTYAAYEDQIRSEYPDQTILELALSYHQRGADEDAIEVLQEGAAKADNPLVGLWLAYLNRDTPNDVVGYEELAASLQKQFIFPYRIETLRMLDWVAGPDDRWEWSYLLGLNLWAMDRKDEALKTFRALGTAPTLPEFYASRASLEEQSSAANTDPDAADPDATGFDAAASDLRHARDLASNNRLFAQSLVTFYQRHAQWQEALEASTKARRVHPGDFNLAILHAKSLLYLRRPTEALEILDATDVLPSESARESHQLFADAHVMAGLNLLTDSVTGEPKTDLELGILRAARAHFEEALEWPEHLGQGKPYDRDERLEQILISYCERRLKIDSADPIDFAIGWLDKDDSRSKSLRDSFKKAAMILLKVDN